MVLATGRTMEGAALVLREEIQRSHNEYAAEVGRALSICSVIGEACLIRDSLPIPALAR
jgi:hypothetical protein